MAALDDSRSFLFTDDGWVSPREGSGTDLYVFAYGHDYGEALARLLRRVGPPPVLPRWALGNWWSRYHRYTADELPRAARPLRARAAAVLGRRARHGLAPGRLASPERYGSGWTGYSWERELFPDPEAFLAELHRRGLRVTLNLHPADGVRAFEDAYPAMAEALGRDPGGEEPIAFDITDPAFLEAYLEVLHHPLEAQGVDFWWIDWQQGTHSRIAGIDPLWMLNHFHFLDSGRDGRRAADLLALRRPGQPPLSGRLLGRRASSAGSRWPSSRSSPRPRRTSATAGGATTSAATSSACATTS